MKLQWLLNPTTINAWANFYMMKWDTYLQENPLSLSLIDSSSSQNSQKRFPRFQSDNHDDYLMFRYVMQVLDLMTLDIDHYQYEFRHLAVSAIVMVLGLTFQVFSLADLPPPASKEGNYFIYDRILGNLDIEFSHLVINFVESFCDIRAPDLRDALNYAQLYFAVAPLQQHMPSVLTHDQVST